MAKHGEVTTTYKTAEEMRAGGQSDGDIIAILEKRLAIATTALPKPLKGTGELDLVKARKAVGAINELPKGTADKRFICAHCQRPYKSLRGIVGTHYAFDVGATKFPSHADAKDWAKTGKFQEKLPSGLVCKGIRKGGE